MSENELNERLATLLEKKPGPNPLSSLIDDGLVCDSSGGWWQGEVRWNFDGVFVAWEPVDFNDGRAMLRLIAELERREYILVMQSIRLLSGYAHWATFIGHGQVFPAYETSYAEAVRLAAIKALEAAKGASDVSDS